MLLCYTCESSFLWQGFLKNIPALCVFIIYLFFTASSPILTKRRTLDLRKSLLLCSQLYLLLAVYTSFILFVFFIHISPVNICSHTIIIHRKSMYLVLKFAQNFNNKVTGFPFLFNSLQIIFFMKNQS